MRFTRSLRFVVLCISTSLVLACTTEHQKIDGLRRLEHAYTLPNGDPFVLKFGLGTDIQVNSIVGLPTWRDLGLVLDMHDNRCISKCLSLWFPLLFDDAASGLPSNVTWDSSMFVRPPKTSAAGFMLQQKLVESVSTIENSVSPTQQK